MMIHDTNIYQASAVCQALCLLHNRDSDDDHDDDSKSS